MKKSILSNPAFRYIFEVFVIIFSVTISFYIQDLLNEKDREKLKNDTLKGVLIDMETDISQYNLALDILKYRLIQADSLIMGYYENNRINQVRNYWGFQGQKISMNSLVNTGAIEYIKNPELIRELSFHYDFHYDSMTDNSNAFENLFINLMDYLNKNYEVQGMDNLEIKDLDNIAKTFGSTYYRFSDKEINKMKNDIWLKNHMYNYKLILRLYLSGYTTGLNRIMKINELIIEEINNWPNEKNILTNPAFRYIFEVFIIVFSVTVSFYIQEVINKKEKIELKNKALKGVLMELKSDVSNFNNASGILKARIRMGEEFLNGEVNNSKLNQLMLTFSFTGQNSNYNSLVSTGVIEFIDN